MVWDDLHPAQRISPGEGFAIAVLMWTMIINSGHHCSLHLSSNSGYTLIKDYGIHTSENPITFALSSVSIAGSPSEDICKNAWNPYSTIPLIHIFISKALGLSAHLHSFIHVPFIHLSTHPNTTYLHIFPYIHLTSFLVSIHTTIQASLMHTPIDPSSHPPTYLFTHPFTHFF